MTKKDKRVSREQQAPLRESLEKRLALYALAAGAAGVALTAASQLAQANIFTYTPSPALTVTANGSQAFSGTFKSSQGASLRLPFLALSRKPFSSAIDVLLAKTAASGFPDVMVGAGTPYPLILKLGADASIGPKGSFKSSGLLEAHSNGGRYTANGQVQERDILAWTSVSKAILFWLGKGQQ